MTTISQNRISSRNSAEICVRKDLKAIIDGISNQTLSSIVFVESTVDDVIHVEAAIHGPIQTPYQDGIFFLSIRLDGDYPYAPPESIIFRQPIMHPNVNECGVFTSDFLQKTNWSPSTTICDILMQIEVRLAFPDIDAGNWDATRGQLYRTDKTQFEVTAREYTAQYAILAPEHFQN